VVWWDRHIGTGHEFAAEIETALEKSDLVVVAWSKHAARSPWVRDEAAVGRDRGRLFPVIIDGGQAPIGFRQFQALDLSGWKGRDKDPRTGQLIEAVNGQLSGKPAEFRRSASRFGWVGNRASWIAALALTLILGAAILFFLNGRVGQGGSLSRPTIALLPITTASPDPELREAASQTRDSIAHTFSQSGVPLKLMSSAGKEGQPAVDFLISGDVSRSGEKVLATIRLDEAAHGVTVYSHRFEASRDEVRDLPERIGAQMAGNLTWSAPMMMLDRRRPLDPAILADLLQSADFTSDPLQAYQVGKRAAAKAPDFQITQMNVAFNTVFVLADLPREERDEAVAEARRAADRSVELGPKFGDAYSPWCLLRSETLFAECEDRLRAARRVDPDAPFLNTFLSHLLRNVGRFDESMELARLAHTHDVYLPTKIGWMLKAMEFDGDSNGARELYQQGALWWPEYKYMFFRNRLFSLVERGDFKAIQRLEREVEVKSQDPDYRDSSGLVVALNSRSVAAGRRSCPDSDAFLLNVRCMIALANLGDQDGAYAIAEKLYPRRLGRTPAETERIWLDQPDIAPPEFITSPAAAPMRRDLRYLQLAQRIGLLAYWRSGRPPDFCRHNPEPICAKLMKRR
jgi:TolB-like protein